MATVDFDTTWYQPRYYHLVSWVILPSGITADTTLKKLSRKKLRRKKRSLKTTPLTMYQENGQTSPDTEAPWEPHGETYYRLNRGNDDVRGSAMLKAPYEQSVTQPRLSTMSKRRCYYSAMYSAPATPPMAVAGASAEAQEASHCHCVLRLAHTAPRSAQRPGGRYTRRPRGAEPRGTWQNYGSRRFAGGEAEPGRENPAGSKQDPSHAGRLD
jgi:hypothetical protein